MTRMHRILIGMVVAQLVLVGLVFLRGMPGSGQAVAAPLLGDIKAEDITSLAIRDDQGKTVRLAKGASGWVLPDAGDFTADSAKITPLTTKLAALKTGKLVAQNESNFKRLQVADDAYQRKIDITTASGVQRTLYLGTSAGGSAAHVRVSGQNDVYVASDLTAYNANADAGSWINTQYFDVAQADVVGLTLTNAGGKYVFAKDAQGAWTMQGLGPGELLSTNNLSTILTIATSIRMTRPLGKTDQPEYGMAQPSATIVLRTQSPAPAGMKDNQQKDYTLTIGARDAKESAYAVKSSESPYYVQVTDYSVSELVERKKENFLQLPTPTPGPTPKQ